MYLLTERALQMLRSTSYASPVDLIDSLYSETYQYGIRITGNSSLRKTFALNALVSVDNALWLLYAKENGIRNFDQLIPCEYSSAFSEKHERVAAIPLISYNVKTSDIRSQVQQGYFFMKIKIGQAGSQQEMLQKDTERLTEIHNVLKDIRTPYTQSGKIPYYFDANGRYEEKETFLRFLDHAKKIGAFDQIAIVEEPFPENYEMDVSDIPVRLAADETAHTEADTVQRIAMGYKAVALKPIAKTLSMTMKIAKAASDRSIPCFCADLTVNPVLVEWNKNVAARLKPFPGLDQIGLMESNGHQNYVNWRSMEQRTPFYGEPWQKMEKGFYHTSESFYMRGGGIFDPIFYYEEIFNNKFK
jgi:L-alanine-DL-glutamate epimerase-like enolase superfamily enzyme